MEDWVGNVNRIIVGNALELLPRLEANSIHCSVSSPPYYGLRKYSGTQRCEWPEIEYSPMSGLPLIRILGCDPDCEHEWGNDLVLHKRGKVGDYSTLEGGDQERIEKARQGSYCQKCGGWRGALGNEPAIEMYIGHLVAIYREVYRVLREDGVAWVVMGDSYGHGTDAGRKEGGPKQQTNVGANTNARHGGKAGDLMMVPHRLALALQADSWIVRNDVVWHKKAPMPESVAGWRWQRHRIKVKKSDRASNLYQNGAGTKQGAGVASRAQREAYYEKGEGAPQWIDCPGCPKCEANGGYVLKRGSWRHTRAHEFVFMLTKRMGYWSNQEAVREPSKMKPQRRLKQRDSERDKAMRDDKKYLYELRDEPDIEGNRSGRNPRSVLTPKPEPFPGSHFAVYPTSLIEPLIKATCPAKCCPRCGMGWSPVVERSRSFESGSGKAGNRPKGKYKDQEGHGLIGDDLRMGPTVQSNVLGYRPSCTCEPAIDDPGAMVAFEPGGDEGNWQPTPVPGTVLDPFIGSGTTALVAIKLNLHYYGCDVSQEYVDLANKRIEKATAQMRMRLDSIAR